MTLTRISTAALACALLTACGAGTTTPAKTVTVTPTAETPAPAAGKKAAASTKPKSVKKVKIPNVVGKGHQAAQDFLQSKGFYALAEKDATGQGRLLLFDRNWVVVKQTPKAGTLADPDKVTITLYSKKIGE